MSSRKMSLVLILAVVTAALCATTVAFACHDLGFGLIIICGLPKSGPVASATLVSAVPQKDAQFVKVDFFVDGKVVFTDDKAPFEMAWDPKTVANGEHKLMARGYDGHDGFADTETITVTVKN